MPTSISEKLLFGTTLRLTGKYQEALDLVNNIEKNEELTPEERVEFMIFKGGLYIDLSKFNDALNIAEQVYQYSKEMGNKLRILDAWNIKALSLFYLFKYKEFVELLIEFEKLFNTLIGVPPRELTRRKGMLMAGKAGLHVIKGQINIAIKYQKKAAKLYEGIDDKNNEAFNHYYTALDYYTLGKLDQALKYGKKVLAIKEIRNLYTIRALNLIGLIYNVKGELDFSLDYHEQALRIAEELDYNPGIIECLFNVGKIYFLRGNLEKALEFQNKCVTFSEKCEISTQLIYAFRYLVTIYVEKDSVEKARLYLKRMRQLRDQYKRPFFNHIYRVAKADFLKSSHVKDIHKAEKLLRQVTEDDFEYTEITCYALLSLCGILLGKVSKTNNPEILNEIKSIINRLLKISKEQRSYKWLVYTHLMRAKLALIETDIERARRLFTQAQETAEWHGLNISAQVVSLEHDLVLKEIEKWEELHKTNAPFSERIDLALLESTIDIILEKRTVKTPELIHEEPVLLLIIAEGGIPAFSNSFTKDWSFEEGFISNFLTAFNTFSNEVFSKGLDRAMFGEFMLIMESIGPYSVCYLFKGQSYLAKQKLIQFAHRVQNTTTIWNALEDFQKSHQAIKLSGNPYLESLITEIFIKKSPEISTQVIS
ncbi:MAG: tetratricopeptide repeat protein [Candidatus Hodarchaeota archaeon]